MSTDQVEIVLTAQDRASKPIAAVERKLLDMSKSARLLKREARGVSTFANALDTLAGTRLGGLIVDLTTVAEVAHPLKNLGGAIADDVAAGLNKVPGSAKVKGAAGKIGTTIVSGIGGLAAAATATAGGTALGLVAGGAFVVGIEHGIPALGSILAEKIAGTDAEGQARQVGMELADHIIAGASAEGKANFAEQFVKAVASGQTWDQAAAALQSVWVRSVDPMATLAAHAFSEHADDLKAAATNAGSDMGRALAAKEIWDKSARAITGDLATALESTPDVVTTAILKAQLAAAHPNAQAEQEALIQRGIAKISALETAGNVTPGQMTIFEQQKRVLQDQLTNITGRSITPTQSSVPVHSHDIYINGRKVMDAIDPIIGQRLAMSSSAPYTRN